MAHDYHAPVLLHDCLEGLNVRSDGTYVDATFGGGGHGRAILGRLGPAGRLIAFDRDADAQANAPDDPRFSLVRADFRWLHNYLHYLGALPIDGLLADLGVSSHQFDTGGRGFSFRSDGPLDMRMDQRARRTAAQLLRQWDEAALARVLERYGEVRGARRVARRIKEAGAQRPIDTTARLADAVRPMAPRGQEAGFLAQVFQALRIAVNDELAGLEALLHHATRDLRPGGRLVVISYHSLEDRLVKHWMRSGDPDGVVRQDVRGNPIRPFEPITRKAVRPSDHEMELNPRARSARLRIAERT
ncbi:MAG: 16S rRNA (cytosine(1402)-N(4))-methyltransferase RsmH [Flavobacteriales bacterium]|jgi:16S rRNA (cytosine1402-N4)-methyltransferase|nr:16S rRNA (cytosine(1402)-N(4))-methyltransferase RsmH [Flavobacteriales bacterium]